MSSNRPIVICLLTLAAGAGCDFLSATEDQGSSLPKAKAQLLAAGRLHACALTNEGGVRCWGYGPEGRLGDGKTYQYERVPAVQVVGLERGVSYLASGPISDVTCAVVAGAVKCWGDGRNGELGNGRAEIATTPVEVSGISDATMVAVGGSHVCALRAGGKVSCWGNNVDLQCGQAEGIEFLAPVEVAGLTGVTKLLAAGANTCVLSGGGGLLCWGSNRYGQLGDGTGGNPNDERAQPAAVLGLGSGVTSAASGSIFGLAVIDGAVRMWGSFRAEELEPIAAPAFPAPVTAIAAGQSSERGYGCGITDKGTYCWGDNSAGITGPYESEDGQYFADEPQPVSSLD